LSCQPAPTSASMGPSRRRQVLTLDKAALTSPAASAFPPASRSFPCAKARAKSPPSTTARAYRNPGSSRPLSAASTGPVVTPRRSPVFLQTQYPPDLEARPERRKSTAGDPVRARTIVPIRRTCRLRSGTRETAFLFGGNAPPLTRIARSAGAAVPQLTAPSGEPESTVPARPDRPTSAPPSVPKSPREPPPPQIAEMPTTPTPLKKRGGGVGRNAAQSAARKTVHLLNGRLIKERHEKRTECGTGCYRKNGRNAA
jgi:hypothetical protein